MRVIATAAASFTLFCIYAITPAMAQSIVDFKRLDAKFGPMHLQDIEKLASDGVVDAQAIMGIYYSNGIRVAKNKKTAEEWYLRAARQGHQDAQYNLGQMYRNGDLGRPDYPAALHWYEEAAKNGVAFAASNIAGMHHDGLGVQSSALMTTKWLFVAKQWGDDRATYTLYVIRRTLPGGEYTGAQQLAAEWMAKNKP